jgi:hypothetical protein
VPKTFAEIKPLSIYGIAKGIGQLKKYEESLKGLNYIRDKWPPIMGTCYYNYQPYFYFNINGLILYTTIKPVAVPIGISAARVVATSQATQLAKGVTTTLEDVVGKMAENTEEFEEGELEADEIEEIY